ncbi:MAG: helix-turn-helix domain-containing protein [Rhodoplanes sp.]|uniref:IclR family transcriptional regulator n=1 Tax=Rhodoplanes sp. TaxID=1968906 RepID=UPI001854B40C|nr:IclR family transcriptional regulator C-terminal domain-containing protein [Rhodoplanes sp.]NVO12477.1 helix-turn-helix domain-containing protein [Rhodoplanes sp.]
MVGLARFVRILRLFDEERCVWTVPEMASALGQPASSVYRAVRELVAAAFLEPATEAHYRLGAAFVEFDRLVRLTDPLMRLGEPRLADVAHQAGVPCAVLLARLFGDTVMCVADTRTGALPRRPSYERGRPMPLTRGATSKTILAQLPARRLLRLIARIEGEATPLAQITELRDILSVIRKRGHCVSRGEIDDGLAGLAVPIAVPELGIAASLSLVVEAARLDAGLEHRLVLMLLASACLLVDQLGASTGGVAGTGAS